MLGVVRMSVGASCVQYSMGKRRLRCFVLGVGGQSSGHKQTTHNQTQITPSTHPSLPSPLSHTPTYILPTHTHTHTFTHAILNEMVDTCISVHLPHFIHYGRPKPYQNKPTYRHHRG